jgi:hypothetical protein
LTTPVDLDKPVENPELSAALREFVANRDARTEQELTQQLRRAVFLVPMLADQVQIGAAAEPGSHVIEQGSRIKILSCVDSAGAQHLPLFTDWAALRTWTEQPVSTLVVPAAEAWESVLSRSEYAGAVLNPGGGEHALPLNRETIAFLRGAPQPEGAEDVEDAIADLAEDASEANRIELYVALQGATLVLGALGVPKDWVNAGGGTVDENTQIQMLTSKAPDGSLVLLAFTSAEELERAQPGTPYFAMRALDVLRLIADGSYSGLVLNPAGRWALIPKLDAEVVIADAASRNPA